jgi:YidC/Oxa1 family membrane protein insertase
VLLSILQAIFYYPIFNVLMFLNWLVHDFALSIVLLTLGIRAAMIPLTRKQLQSQRKMMEIQPLVNQLKEQYKGDQQGFAKAQMQLYKDNNVSMLGGCLPLLIQLPFLYGLFYALKQGLGNGNPNDAHNIAGINSLIYPFLKFANLTMPGGSHPLNTYLDWFAWLPWHPMLNLNAPDPTHILPIVAALFTFISVRQMQGSRQMQQMQAARGTPSDPKKASQQGMQTQMMGMMSYITPIFTLIFAWQYAAGLALYWTVSTLFGFAQQFYINGWGGTFKGIPRLDEWARQWDARREARRLERLQAPESSSLSNLVEGTAAKIRSLAPPTSKIEANGSSNGVTKSGKETSRSESADWIEQAKAENQGTAPKRKERPKPFVTLVPTPPTRPLSETAAESGAENELTNAATGVKANGAKATNGARSNGNTGSGAKSNSPTNTPKTGAPSAKRKVPPRSGSLPKPKGGKK